MEAEIENSLKNLHNFEQFINRSVTVANRNAENLSCHFSLWLKDTKSIITGAVTLNKKEINLNGFDIHAINSDFQEKVFCDFDKVNVQSQVECENIEKELDNMILANRRARKRRADSLDNGDYLKTKRAKLARNFNSNWYIGHTEHAAHNLYSGHDKNTVQKEELNGLSERGSNEQSTCADIEDKKHQQNVIIKKKFDEEKDIIHEQPSVEEENMNVKYSNKPKTPASSVFSDGGNINPNVLSEIIKTIEAEDKYLREETTNAKKLQEPLKLEFKTFSKENNIKEEQKKIMNISKTNKPSTNVTSIQLNQSPHFSTLASHYNKTAAQTVGYYTSQNHNNSNITPNIASNVSNVTHVKAIKTPKQVTNPSAGNNHNFTFHKEKEKAEEKNIGKTNLIKENLYEFLFNDESYSNLEESPAVEQWNPSSNVERIQTVTKMNIKAKSVVPTSSKPIVLTVGKYKIDMDKTYEITDNSGSDSGEDSDEDFGIQDKKFKILTPCFKPTAKRRKQIPDWANDNNYIMNRVNYQKTELNHREIFGVCKIDNLDLNLVFSTEKARFYKRGDSADWRLDNTIRSSMTIRNSIERLSNNNTNRQLFSDIKVNCD